MFKDVHWLGFLGSSCQDRVRGIRGLSGVIPVKDKGKREQEERGNLQTVRLIWPLWREMRKERRSGKQSVSPQQKSPLACWGAWVSGGPQDACSVSLSSTTAALRPQLRPVCGAHGFRFKLKQTLQTPPGQPLAAFPVAASLFKGDLSNVLLWLPKWEECHD